MHSLIAGIASSFTDNMIAEQRYRMILNGLQVTLQKPSLMNLPVAKLFMTSVCLRPK